MNVYISESDMTFGPFDQDRLFHIDKSDVYRQIGENVKTVEYIYLNDRKTLQLVEVKTSMPNIDTRSESQEKQEKYEKDYQDLTDKFVHSVNLLTAVLLGKHGQMQDVGETLASISSFRDIRFCFILVVRNSEDQWLAGPKAELDYRLKAFRKIWKADVIVLNEELAKKKGLLAS